MDIFPLSGIIKWALSYLFDMQLRWETQYLDMFDFAPHGIMGSS